ncbi:MAG: 2-phospho-L-lactate guanylyltransferase [Chloroflexota bacterium]
MSEDLVIENGETGLRAGTQVPRVWAVLPAKDLGQAKSRLAPLLTPREREQLMLRLLQGTIDALRAAPSLAGWLVVSPDTRLLALAQARGGHVLREEPRAGQFDLNAALRQARDAVVARGASAILILPGDLPLVRPEAIEALLAVALRTDSGVLLAPARDGRGTNALLLTPPDALEFSFGPDSAPRHAAAAQEAGLPLLLHQDAAFALDLDTPADLEAVARLQGQWLDAPLVCYV